MKGCKFDFRANGQLNSLMDTCEVQQVEKIYSLPKTHNGVISNNGQVLSGPILFRVRSSICLLTIIEEKKTS